MSKDRFVRSGVGCVLVLAVAMWGGSSRGDTTVGFDTGTLQGTVLSTGGAAPANAFVRASACSRPTPSDPCTPTGSQLQAPTDPMGSYTLTLPVGDYVVEAMFGMNQWSLGTQTVTVTKSSPASATFTFRAGQVSASVGAGVDAASATPAQNAQIYFQEAAPTCGVPGASCNVFDPSDPTSCDCTLSGRHYFCKGGQCMWQQPRTSILSTGPDGRATGVLLEGIYAYTVASGMTATGGMPGPMMQSGQVAVGSGTTSVVDGGVIDLGQTLYETGTVGGTITGAGSQSIMLQAVATDGTGSFNTWLGGAMTPSTTYAFVLPTRDYHVTLYVNGASVKTQDVAIDVGSSLTLDFDVTQNTHQVSGTVFRDGAPIGGAMVNGYETPPAGVSCNPSCRDFYSDPSGFSKCDHCPLGDRFYICGTFPDPSDPKTMTTACAWEQARSFTTSTASDGTFSVAVAPGSYAVQFYSGQEGGPMAPPPPPAPPVPPASWQMGSVLVSTMPNVVVDTTDVALPSVNYATGTIAGAATSCGAPLPNVSIVARAANGFGQIQSYDDDTGHYALRVPIGDYDAQLLWQYTFGSSSSRLHVGAGATTPYDLNLDLGTVHGIVLANGGPSAYSPIQIVEKAPAGCDVAGATCNDKIDPATGTNYGCFCTLGARNYNCFPAPPLPGTTTFGPMVCQWNDQHTFPAMTGPDGRFNATVFAGAYTVIAYAPNMPGHPPGMPPGPPGMPPPGPGQTGAIEVARWDANVVACGAADVATSSATIDPSTGVAKLGDGATLTFPPSSPLAGSTISMTATSVPPNVPSTPPDATIQFAGTFYDFTLPAGTSIPTGQTVQVCLDYEHVDSTNLTLYHYARQADGSMAWVALDGITVTQVDANTYRVCGDTPSFSWFTVAKITGVRPTIVLNAPSSLVADAACKSIAHLDASATTGTAPMTFDWKVDGVAAGQGPKLDAPLTGAAQHVVTLTVTNAIGVSATTATIALRDTTAPTLSAALAPSVIWPPNGKMTQLTPTLSARDNCDAQPTVTLVSLTSPTAKAADMSTSGGVYVRADRAGTETSGRTYTAQWAATDASGNKTTSAASVLVPHDQGK